MPRTQPQSKRMLEALRLRRLREQLNISQRDLASEFRVAHTAVSSWESGARTIPGPVLKLMEIYEDQAGMKEERPTHSDLPASWVSRNIKLSLAVAGLAGRFASQFLLKWTGVKTAPPRSTPRLVETLGNLKGLMMKAGQMLSYIHVGQSESLREPFEILQSKASPLHPELIDSMIRQELGASPRFLFSHWNPIPIGMGSIGQVHEASLPDGTELAVKVQYPGIQKTLQTDLQYTRFIDLFGTLIFRDQDRESFVKELSLLADQECDYSLERTHQEAFRTFYENDPQILIPRTYPELSTGRVLTQEKLSGRSFRSFCETGSQTDRNEVGSVLFRFAFTSLLNHQLLNCDPHPGNYQFKGTSVIFYDFGCVKKLDPAFVDEFKSLIHAMLSGNREAVAGLATKMGYVPNPESFDFDHHYEILEFLYLPWLTPGSFAFTPAYVEEVWNRIILNNKNRARSSVPQNWIFVNRLQWGLYSVLADLRAEADWGKILRSLL